MQQLLLSTRETMVGGCPSPLLPLASVSTPPMWHPPSPPAAAFLCRPPSSSSVVWGERRRCEPLRMFDDHQGGQGQQRPPKRQHGAGIRGGSSHRPGWQKAERELWEARRGIARYVVSMGELVGLSIWPIWDGTQNAYT